MTLTAPDSSTVTSPYIEELQRRAQGIRTGIHYMSQVSGSQEAQTLAHDVLVTVEAQIAEETAKASAYLERAAQRIAAREAQRKRPCYCDYSYHPNGC